LRANTTADARQRVVSLDQSTGANRITGFDKLDELRNFDGNRAPVHAEGFATLQASLRFDEGLPGGKTKRDFLKVADAFLRWQLRHDLALFARLRCLLFKQLKFNISNLGVEATFFRVVVGAIAVNDHVEIHQVPIEFGTINTGEFDFVSHLHTAAAAHASAIDHDGVETDGGWDPIRAS